MKQRASILLEFDLPRTAIKKLDRYIPDYVENSQDMLNYIKKSQITIKVNANLSSYKFERLKKEVL